MRPMNMTITDGLRRAQCAGREALKNFALYDRADAAAGFAQRFELRFQMAQFQHALRNVSDSPVRWAQMLAPQPRARVQGDTYPVPTLPEEVIRRTREKYADAFRLLSGRELQ